jgi:hypothetical protein
MAAYDSGDITSKAPARLVSIGLTPKYEEIDPTTLNAGDVFSVFLVPGGVRIFDAFVRAVGGTGLDTNGTPTLTTKLEIVDDAGTTVLIATNSTVRATGTEKDMDTSKGYLVDSDHNDAVVKLTAVAAAATLGTSNIGVGILYSSYSDN